MIVTLLAHTPDPLKLIYAAVRQCYSADSAHSIMMNDYGDECMESLVSNVIASGHTSVIEHVSFTFGIEGISRACSHQLVRHRVGCSYSQQSQRYVEHDLTDSGIVIPPIIGANEDARRAFNDAVLDMHCAYNAMVQDFKIPKEDARFILPNASVTSIVVTMNCRALLNLFDFRLCQRAQWEIRSMAAEMLDYCADVLPVVFKDAGPRCVKLGYCPEKDGCGRYPKKVEK